ncbi:MAG: HNH endonuclease signature motif containing protein [Desulfomonilaceae bacterium]
MNERSKKDQHPDVWWQYEDFELAPVTKDHIQHEGKNLHRVIAELKTGRKIPKGKHVHHINMRKRDNRPENLVIIPKEIHTKHHKTMNGLVGHLMEFGIIEFSETDGYRIVLSSLSEDMKDRREKALAERPKFNPYEYIRNKENVPRNDSPTCRFVLDFLERGYPAEWTSPQIALGVSRSNQHVSKALNILVQSGKVLCRKSPLDKKNVSDLIRLTLRPELFIKRRSDSGESGCESQSFLISDGNSFLETVTILM